MQLKIAAAWLLEAKPPLDTLNNDLVVQCRAQEDREIALKDLKTGEVRILIATGFFFFSTFIYYPSVLDRQYIIYYS